MARSQNERKTPWGARWLWIIILICVLGGAMTGLWFFMKGDAEHIENLQQGGADPNWP